MERSEPTLIPEWLKNAGNSPGGGSVSQSDNHSTTRNKSFVNTNVADLGKSSNFERSTSSYFRRGSSGNGSGRLRSHGSFGRNQRDRDRDKDTHYPQEKDNLVLSDRRLWDFPEPLGDTLTSKFDKDGLRRSHSMISGKRGETWSKKVVDDSCNANGSHNNGVANKSSIVGVKKQIFERDFPSLGADGKTVASEIGRVPSPGVGSALQNYPIGSSVMISGEKWTSALAEVPVLAESNESVTSFQLQNSTSGSKSMGMGLNMAEAVVLGPSRAQTPPQLSVGTQRFEELAIRQSKQLIPMTPSLPRTLVSSSSDKQKNKSTQQLFPLSSSLSLNQSPRGGGPVKSDVSKSSNAGKLHVLIQGREKNCVSSVLKDNSSPKSGDKTVASVISSSAPALHSAASTKVPPSSSVFENKPVLTLLEKKPASQARSRNDFFNSVRKQSMGNYPSSVSDSSSETSLSVLDASLPLSDKASEIEVVPTHDSPEPVDVATEIIRSENNSSVDKAELTRNGDICIQRDVRGKENPNLDPIISEEEEAAFLRSLGWDENNDEGGLTEEEISAFYMDLSKYINSNTSLRILQGVRHKLMVPFDSQIGGVGDAQLES